MPLLVISGHMHIESTNCGERDCEKACGPRRSDSDNYPTCRPRLGLVNLNFVFLQELVIAHQPTIFVNWNVCESSQHISGCTLSLLLNGTAGKGVQHPRVRPYSAHAYLITPRPGLQPSLFALLAHSHCALHITFEILTYIPRSFALPHTRGEKAG